MMNEKIKNVTELLEKPYLTEKEAAMVTGYSVFTLRNNRFQRRNLPFIKIGAGRSIRYRTEDIIKFMEGHSVLSEEVTK